MKRRALLALLLALGCGGSGSSAGDASVDAVSFDAVPPDAAVPDAKPAVDCENLATLPVSYTTLTGFSGSEDFAFDAAGNLVSTGFQGITKQPKTGDATLFSPNVSGTAGTRYLSNGDLVIADVGNDSLLRITTSGSPQTIVTGIQYPNGVEVDMENFVYVSEHDQGNIWRVNPDTGEFSIIASGLYQPNGLSFSPDYRTLYVNSFGGGTVHKVTVDDEGNWSSPVLLGRVSDNFGGDLDGMAVDACGNVYVTEWIEGVVWRFSPDGMLEKVVTLPSQWIPNLHWGSGVGGWDKNILYVMDRDEGRVFELDLGIVEKDQVYP